MININTLANRDFTSIVAACRDFTLNAALGAELLERLERAIIRRNPHLHIVAQEFANKSPIVILTSLVFFDRTGTAGVGFGVGVASAVTGADYGVREKNIV